MTFYLQNFSQKIFELLGIDMANWLEVSCEADISYDSQPDLITLESDSSFGLWNLPLKVHTVLHFTKFLPSPDFSYGPEMIEGICYRVHYRLKQTRLIIISPISVPDAEIADCVKINLSADFAFESRLRFNVALKVHTSTITALPSAQERTLT